MYKKLILRIFYISYHSSITTQKLFTKKHSSLKVSLIICRLLHFYSTISKRNYPFHFFKIITSNHILPLSFFKIITTNHILPLSFLEFVTVNTYLIHFYNILATDLFKISFMLLCVLRFVVICLGHWKITNRTTNTFRLKCFIVVLPCVSIFLIFCISFSLNLISSMFMFYKFLILH